MMDFLDKTGKEAMVLVIDILIPTPAQKWSTASAQKTDQPCFVSKCQSPQIS